METSPSPKQPKPKKFTRKMQEAFLLRCLGLKNATIKIEMGQPTEEAVEQLICRALSLFDLDPQTKAIELAIAIAVRTKLVDALCNKFRAKHASWITAYEQKEFTAPVVGLPEWNGGK